MRTDTVLRKNGCAKKSVSGQSKKSIITDDVLDELAVMETSIHSRRRKVFYQQMRLFCQRSTLHGLSDLCRAENWYLRLFWLTTFLGALAAAVYGCYHILEQYMESPVMVSYFVHESDLRFALPDLVICPFNRFNSEFLTNNSVSMDVAQHMQLVFGFNSKHPAQRKELKRLTEHANLVAMDLAMNQTLDRLNMTFEEFLEEASLKCKDFFVDCAYPTGPVDCCANITGILTFAGKCFRIRGVNQSGPGYGYGMTIVVTLPKQKYSLAVNNWLNDGILLKLAEPDQGIDYDMTFVPVGTHALMPLKATKYEFMDDPPRFVCLTHTEPNYSRVECFDECYFKAAQNYCGCATVSNRNIHGLPLCRTIQFHECMFKFLWNQFKENTDADHFFYGCRQECRPRCTYWQYHSAISYSKFPSEDAKKFTNDETEWTKMKNTIILDLYYEKLEFTKIKHYRALTIHGFIANLGGQYSLWLGGSILTLMQMLVFICNYAIGRCTRFVKTRQKSPGHRPIATGVIRKEYTFQSPPKKSSSSFWKRRASSSAGPSNVVRRPSSDDFHPQLQALNQLNHVNGSCCRDQRADEDPNRLGRMSTSGGAPYYSWTDLNRVGHVPVEQHIHMNGGYRRRSPSVEIDQFTSGVFRRHQCESSILDDFRLKQWTSQT